MVQKIGFYGAIVGAAIAFTGALVNTIHALPSQTAVYTMVLLVAMAAGAAFGARALWRIEKVFATLLVAFVAQLFVLVAQHSWWQWFGHLMHS